MGLKVVEVPFCILNYRVPEMVLGSQSFWDDVDSWAVGCMAAELFLRDSLFPLEDPELSAVGPSAEQSMIGQQLALLGAPSPTTRAWLMTLPFTAKLLKKEGFPQRLHQPPWTPERLRGCSPDLLDFIGQCLK